MGHYHYAGQEYCDDCLPVNYPNDKESEFVDVDDGEQDTPANCVGCGIPLNYTLTQEGVQYVIQAITDALEEGLDTHIIPTKGTGEETLTHYHESPHYEIVRDWATDLTSYNLTEEEIRIVDTFLGFCQVEDKLRNKV